MIRFCSIFVLCLLAFGTLAGAAPRPVIEGGARVVDGDTLVVAGQKVRLFGIDAPERDQTCERGGQSWDCGAWSTDSLSDLVQGRQLTCDVQDTDRYGRAVAVCRAGATDLAQAMVQGGAAQAYRKYSRRYLPDEAAARAAGAGIWGGDMVDPQEFRHAVPPVAVPARDCRIKGNIGASGRIYHMPGQHDYAATRISPAKGEAWFCLESQARAAGFRKARR